MDSTIDSTVDINLDTLIDLLPHAITYPGFGAWTVDYDYRNDRIQLTGSYNTINYAGHAGRIYDFGAYLTHNPASIISSWIIEDIDSNIIDALPCDPCLNDYVVDTICDVLRSYNDILDSHNTGAVMQRLLYYITCNHTCDLATRSPYEITTMVSTLARSHPLLLSSRNLIALAGDVLDLRRQLIEYDTRS